MKFKYNTKISNTNLDLSYGPFFFQDAMMAYNKGLTVKFGYSEKATKFQKPST